MKITHVDVHLVPPADDWRPVHWRTGLPEARRPRRAAAWLKVHTDEGISGLAHSARGELIADLVDRYVRDEIVGGDPLRREYFWHRIWELDRLESLPLDMLGVLDIALWDLAAKAAGLPLHQLLGSFRTAIPAYASTATFSSVAEYLDVADQCLALGYPAIKLHAWGDARRDAELCAALREHVGDTVPLMYDGSAGFDVPEALYLGQVLADNGYNWYEEPIREFSVTAYRWLAERVSVPLLVAETSAGAHMNVGDFVASGCASFVRASAGLKGGITGAIRIAHLADAFRIRAEVHGGGLPNTHLCMAIPNTTYYESLVDTNPVARESAVDAGGLVHAPTAAGIGYENIRPC